MMSVALTGVLGAFFTAIGLVKCFQIVPDVYDMQLEAISTRYQPVLVSFTPDFLSEWLATLPTERLIFLIGAPELAFGVFLVCILMSGMVPRHVDKTVNQFMILFMMGPLVSHWFGDDWTLPMDSNVGPTGIVPALVVTTLLSLRLILLVQQHDAATTSSSGNNKQKTN